MNAKKTLPTACIALLLVSAIAARDLTDYEGPLAIRASRIHSVSSGVIHDGVVVTRRGVEAMDNTYRLLDFAVYGRQEKWEDSPTGWPQWWEGEQRMRTDGRPTSQWSRLKAGHPDDLGTGR